jgi:hypothetical protein
MNKLATTLIVIICMTSFGSIAQNQDDFESLISLLQDKDSKEIIYSVQLGAFEKQHKEGHFDSVEHLFSHSYDDRLTRFFSKLFRSLNDAVAYRNSIRLKGYTDAFVLGLDGGFDRILLEVD